MISQGQDTMAEEGKSQVMLGWLGHKVRPIGLDIGHNAIKMLQCAVNGAQVRVVAADKVRFTPEANSNAEKRRQFTVCAIQEMLIRNGFRNRKVVSCLPNDVLRVKSFRVDASGEEIEGVLTRKIAQQFGLDPDKDEISYMVAGDVLQGDEVKTELILFAVDRESIRSHIELLEEAGLNPVGIDTVPCSLFRSFERSLRRQEDKNIVNVFVDLGSRYTTVVVGRGKDVSFVKQIPVGSEKFTDQVAQQLGVDGAEATALRSKLGDGGSSEGLDAATRQAVLDSMRAVAEELAREISLCFRYYAVTFRGKRPGRAIFTGGGVYDSTVLGELKGRLAVEVEVAEPLKGFDLTRVNFESDRRGLLSEWAVAVGLILKGWRGVNDRLSGYERNRLSSTMV